MTHPSRVRLRGLALLALAGASAGAGCDFGSAAAPGRADLAPGGGDVDLGPAGGAADLAVRSDLASAPALGAAYNDPQLAARQLDYPAALRTAALKLTGDLPTSDHAIEVATAAVPSTTYNTRIDAYLATPQRFHRELVAFFRNTFRAGGAVQGMPSYETAAVYAARLVAEDRPFTEVLTGAANTCPTFNPNTGAFTDGACANGAPKTAGVLTDPGILGLFTSNMAFRRVRWVQETFACNKFPAEWRDPPTMLASGALYTSPWPLTSISGNRVNFLEQQTLVCANCHTTLNHLAPLFGNFDALGRYQQAIQVTTPVMGLPKTEMTDWLPQGETTAWRFGVPAADLAALGQAIAQDPSFATCMAMRVFAWAMSKDDVVDASAPIPDSVIKPFAEHFRNNGYHLKPIIREVFTSDDFVRF